MTVHSFDALTRFASSAISRRGSLLTIGGAGLTALTGSSVVQAAKNPKKKARKQGKKKCQEQVEQCRAFWEEYCQLSGEEDCDEILEEIFTCCETLGQCQPVDFFTCFVEAQNSGNRPQ